MFVDVLNVRETSVTWNHRFQRHSKFQWRPINTNLDANNIGTCTP